MPKWIRTRCNTDHVTGNCVEVQPMATGEVILRSSLNTARDIELTQGEWAAFRSAVKEGQFDEV